MTDGASIKETPFRSIKLKEVDASRAAYDAQHGPPARVSVGRTPRCKTENNGPQVMSNV
jgi:hypothetical protein